MSTDDHRSNFFSGGKDSRREFLKTAARISAVPLLASAVAPAAITAQRYPYVQNIGVDHASVLWTTRESGLGSVQFSDGTTQSFATPQVRQFNPSETGLDFVYYQYQADLKGLSEATSYFYRVFVEGNLLTTANGGDPSFRTAAPVAPFTFLVFGDSGEGSPQQRQLAALMAKEQAALLLHTGDVIYPSGALAGFEALYFAIYRDMMTQVPFFPCPGNHDYETNNAAPYLSVHALPPANVPAADRGRYYSFDWGEVHFISLDTNLLPRKAVSGIGDMLDWLEKDLQNTRKFWRLAYFHHPPYPTSNHINDPLCILAREKLVPILERYRVPLVLSGHEHTYERTFSLRNGVAVNPNTGTQYFISGGGGARLFNVFQKPDFLATSTPANNYLRCEVAGTRLRIRAIGLDGRELDNIELAPLPSPYAQGIVNSASFDPAVSPGALVSIFGAHLAGREERARLPLPSALSGTTVTANGAPVPLLYISPGQINAQLPFDISGRVTIRITTANGSADTVIAVDEVAPRIFDAGAPAILHSNGSLVSAAQPAETEEFISIYAMGLGPLTGPIAAGQLAPLTPLLSTALPVQVKIGGQISTPYFAGLAPGFAGLYQVVVQVPADLRSGSYTLQLALRGMDSNQVNVNVKVRGIAVTAGLPPEKEPAISPLRAWRPDLGSVSDTALVESIEIGSRACSNVVRAFF